MRNTPSLDTDNFPCDVPEYSSIDRLNQMYEMIDELPEEIVDSLKDFISITEALRVSWNTRTRFILSDCDSMEDVARYFADELQTLGNIPIKFTILYRL